MERISSIALLKRRRDKNEDGDPSFSFIIIKIRKHSERS